MHTFRKLPTINPRRAKIEIAKAFTSTEHRRS
jgi:hypothetical protein